VMEVVLMAAVPRLGELVTWDGKVYRPDAVTHDAAPAWWPV